MWDYGSFEGMPYIDSGFHSHPLTPNHLHSFPKRIMYLDTETQTQPHPKGELHTLALAWTCLIRYSPELRALSERWESFTDERELCAYIVLQAREKDPLFIFGHNLYFDLQVTGVFHWLPRWGWKLEFLYDHALSFIMVISRDGSRIKCVSTTNYFDCSLLQLGRSIGLPKLEVDFQKVSASELSTYCRRDVEITRTALEGYMSFNRSKDTGRFSLTKASQALACYRHRFLPSTLELHECEEVIQLERSAYFGGRVECFHLGRIKGGPFRFYDVNSMYPWLMASKRYPCRLLRYYPQATLKELERFRSTACLIVEVELSTPEPAYALRYNGKVVFPVGRFRTSLCTELFWRAVDEGHLAKVHRAAVYQADYIFRPYVRAWWPLKERYKREGNELYKQIVKIFLNSLYGKFGQRGVEIEELPVPDFAGDYILEEEDFTNGERWKQYSFFNRCWIERQAGNARHSFVAIAAHVAEYGRAALWSFITGLGRERVLYCDTDSVVVRSRDGPAVDRLFRRRGLGALELDSRCTSLVLYGLKDYQADGVRKIKGVPHEALDCGADRYQYQSWPGVATHRRLGIDRGYLVRTTKKRLARRYDKGVVSKDGTVHPLELQGD